MKKSNMTFGNLERGELDTAVGVVAQAFGSSFEDAARMDLELTFSNYPYAPVTYVARNEKDTVVGVVQMVSAYIHFNTQGIAWLSVVPEQQGQGVGRSLLAYAEEQAIAHKFNGQAGTFILVDRAHPGYYRALGYQGDDTKMVDGKSLMVKHYRP